MRQKTKSPQNPNLTFSQYRDSRLYYATKVKTELQNVHNRSPELRTRLAESLRPYTRQLRNCGRKISGLGGIRSSRYIYERKNSNRCPKLHLAHTNLVWTEGFLGFRFLLNVFLFIFFPFVTMLHESIYLRGFLFLPETWKIWIVHTLTHLKKKKKSWRRKSAIPKFRTFCSPPEWLIFFSFCLYSFFSPVEQFPPRTAPPLSHHFPSFFVSFFNFFPPVAGPFFL